MPAAWVGAAASLIGATSGGSSGKNKAANDAQQQAAAISADQWNYYKQNYQPLETNLINQAQTAGSPDEFARARGAANADVTGAFDKANKQTTAGLQSMGINPGSPAYQDAQASSNIAQGATTAGALTAADNNTRNLAYSKALDVVGLGKGIPASSAASLNATADSAQKSANSQFLQNQTNLKNIGTAGATLGGAAAKWFGSTPPTPVSTGYGNNAPSFVGDPSVNGGYGDGGTYAADGGAVKPHSIGESYADGGRVVPNAKTGVMDDVDMANQSQQRTGQPASSQQSMSREERAKFDAESRAKAQKLPPSMRQQMGLADGGRVPPIDLRTGKPATEPPPGSHQVDPTTTRQPAVYQQREQRPDNSRGTRNEGVYQTYAEGGNVIDAKKTGDGTYDASGLDSVMHKRGINPEMRKRVVTPHMRHFAGGGGVGRQGLGTDDSDMGMPNDVSQTSQPIDGVGTETSDSIPATIDGQQPAALSSGEFVLNAGVMKLTGAQVAEAINKAGLELRDTENSNDIPAEAGARAYTKGGIIRYQNNGLSAT